MRYSNISLSSAISCIFAVLCVYSKFGDHPHPTAYLCAKFYFISVMASIAELAHGQKLHTQSITPSLTQLI